MPIPSPPEDGSEGERGRPPFSPVLVPPKRRLTTFGAAHRVRSTCDASREFFVLLRRYPSAFQTVHNLASVRRAQAEQFKTCFRRSGRFSLQEHGSASQQGPLAAVWTLESAPYHGTADVTDKTISGWLFVGAARQVARAACGALTTPVPCGPDGWKTLMTMNGFADLCTTGTVRGPEHG